MINHHNHITVCAHKNLEYCQQCDQPHCVDCGREWNAYRVINNGIPATNWPYNGQPTWTVLPSTSGGNTTLPVYQTTCQHS